MDAAQYPFDGISAADANGVFAGQSSACALSHGVASCWGDNAQSDLGTGDDAVHDTMCRNGRRYVDANYRWPVILERYCGFLEAFAAGKGVP